MAPTALHHSTPSLSPVYQLAAVLNDEEKEQEKRDDSKAKHSNLTGRERKKNGK